MDRYLPGAVPMRLLCLLAFLLAAGAAAAEPDPALVEAARKEGAVVWYTGMIINQIVRPMVEAFKNKYPGIDVQYSRAAGNDIALKITNEARAHRPLADMFDSATALGP